MEKFRYTVGYIDMTNNYQVMIIHAGGCEELLHKIAERLPEDAAYINSVKLNRWNSEEEEIY